MKLDPESCLPLDALKGAYVYKYIKVDGHWLFSERYYTVLYNDGGTGNMSGTINPYPDLID